MQANWFWEVTTTGKWSASSKTISVSDSLFNDFHIYVEFGVYLFFVWLFSASLGIRTPDETTVLPQKDEQIIVGKT